MFTKQSRLIAAKRSGSPEAEIPCRPRSSSARGLKVQRTRRPIAPWSIESRSPWYRGTTIPTCACDQPDVRHGKHGYVELAHRRADSRGAAGERPASNSKTCLESIDVLGNEATGEGRSPEVGKPLQTSPARARITDEKILRREGPIQRDLAEEANLRWSGAADADSDSAALLAPSVEFAALAKAGAEACIDRQCRASLGRGALGQERKSAGDYEDNKIG